MAMTFQARGTQFDAYYTKSKKTPAFLNSSATTIVSLAYSGVFGGSAFHFTNTGTGVRAIVWPGMDSMPIGSNGFTVLLRLVPLYTTNPPAFQSIFCMGPGESYGANASTIIGVNADGTMKVFNSSNTGSQMTNYDSALKPAWTNTVPIDIWVSWTGASGANTVKIYTALNGNSPTLLNQTSSGSTYTRTYATNGGIMLGKDNLFNGEASATYVNELVVWDSVVDPTSYGARTDFISATNFEGYNYTDPGVSNVTSSTTYTFAGTSLTGTLGASTDPGESNVRSGTGYTYSGASKTGTLVAPSLANTKIGVAGDGGTGTYDGSDRWTSPLASQLALGVELKSNSTTVNLTGTLENVTNYIVGGELEGQSTESVLEVFND